MIVFGLSLSRSGSAVEDPVCLFVSRTRDSKIRDKTFGPRLGPVSGFGV